MSGVYIKGGRVPISCYSCWHSFEGKCGLLGMDKELPWKGKRKDCPIIELPGHGDLIDKDELSRLVGESFEYFLARLGLKCPKAVIPAERSEDG